MDLIVNFFIYYFSRKLHKFMYYGVLVIYLLWTIPLITDSYGPSGWYFYGTNDEDGFIYLYCGCIKSIFISLV